MKKFCLFAILTIVSLNLFSQVNWEVHQGNPVMTANAESWEDPMLLPGSVIFHEGEYHMWYSGGDFLANGGFFRIGHATSVDGIDWTRDLLPVLDTGSLGEWDDKTVWEPTVLLKDDVFHMWYSGHGNVDASGHGDDEIGHATSTDGIIWVKDEKNPVFKEGNQGTWDDPVVVAPSVIYDGSMYHMYYHASSSPSNGSIGHATSPDGTTWTRDPQNPVISKGIWDTPQTIYGSALHHNNTYQMWYTGGSFLAWDIGYATSEDGSSWSRYGDGPVLNKASEGFGSNFLGAPSVIYDTRDTLYKMWYSGESTDGTFGIGYAESDPRVPSLSVDNSKPVFDSTDMVIAEINLDGIIYIVPDGTSPVIDSLIKYKLASVDALANTVVQIPLSDLSIGQYTVIAVSMDGFVGTNLFRFNIVDNAKPPKLHIEKNNVDQGDTIIVTNDKDGSIYLVIKGTTPDNIFIQTTRLKDSLQVEAGKKAGFPTIDLFPKDYLLYARDEYGFWSEAYEVSVAEVTGGIVTPTSPGIHLYPNPTNELLNIETEYSDHYMVEIITLNGKRILIGEMDGTTHQIDLSSFQKGVYFITIGSKDRVITSKIIKL